MDEFFVTHKPFNEEKIKITESANLPGEVVEMLNKSAANSYANGFFRFTTSNSLKSYFEMWNLPPEECFPFMKFAFGHLAFYHAQQYKVLNPVHNVIDIVGEEGELDFVMNIMFCDRDVLESSFFIDIYEQAFKTLGAPELNEIYAFVPALGLGGSRLAESVQRVKMNTQMTILSQI